ncbi:MAG: flagellar assembly protein FliW [Acidobacteria bacterium]|nr:flagellar assembly protein FliW [Acidobacteriota bacterium]
MTQDEEGTLLELPKGLLGFPGLTKYRLLEPPDAYPLKFLQSEEQPDLSFVVMDVASVKSDYVVPLPEEDARQLALEREEDALVLTLVVVPKDPRRMTTNLAGPLVINARTRVGRQIVLSGDQFPLQYPILGER